VWLVVNDIDQWVQRLGRLSCWRNCINKILMGSRKPSLYVTNSSFFCSTRARPGKTQVPECLVRLRDGGFVAFEIITWLMSIRDTMMLRCRLPSRNRDTQNSILTFGLLRRQYRGFYYGRYIWRACTSLEVKETLKNTARSSAGWVNMKYKVRR
jgi:hypothetical protein